MRARSRQFGTLFVGALLLGACGSTPSTAQDSSAGREARAAIEASARHEASALREATRADANAAMCGTLTNPIIVGPGGGTSGGSMMFAPSSCSVTSGQTVVWQWGSTPHSVTSDPGQVATFDSTTSHTTGDKFSFTIPAGMTGAIHYHCMVHGVVNGGVCSGMCGSLTIH